MPIRLTVVMTHPVQYYAPWFRYIASACPALNLTVLYATEPTARQQGVGFGRSFHWDTPLYGGYRHIIARAAGSNDEVHSGSFFGLNVPEISTALLSTGPEVVLLPGWHSVTQVRTIWTCRRARVPLVYRGDSNLESAPGGLRRHLWEAKTRLLLAQFSAYLSVGRRARAYLDALGLPASPVFESPHAVHNERFAAAVAGARADGNPRARFGAAEDEFIVLFAGKLKESKRIEDLLAAMMRLRPPCRLLVVGSGPKEACLREQARHLGLRVSWAGFLNQSELGRAYAAADCLALPSDSSETWGLVINEALACGVPCVVSDRVGCAPDLVASSDTGEIFPVGNIGALSEALERVRTRLNSGYDYAPSCRDHVARYSYPSATDGLLAACEAVTTCPAAFDPQYGSRPGPPPACSTRSRADV